ncbi:MAG: hypothetical protein RL134_1024 [Actinomycetota bacterium]
MRAWIGHDADATTLLRTGMGVVTAVAEAPRAYADSGASSLVEIAVSAVTPKAIRVTVKATCPRGSELALRAAHLAETGEEVAWLVEWRRLPGVPPQIPITDLQLRTDASAVLLALAGAESEFSDESVGEWARGSAS